VTKNIFELTYQVFIFNKERHKGVFITIFFVVQKYLSQHRLLSPL